MQTTTRRANQCSLDELVPVGWRTRSGESRTSISLGSLGYGLTNELEREGMAVGPDIALRVDRRDAREVARAGEPRVQDDIRGSVALGPATAVFLVDRLSAA